jgi:hypothetical protein
MPIKSVTARINQWAPVCMAEPSHLTHHVRRSLLLLCGAERRARFLLSCVQVGAVNTRAVVLRQSVVCATVETSTRVPTGRHVH